MRFILHALNTWYPGTYNRTCLQWCPVEQFSIFVGLANFVVSCWELTNAGVDKMRHIDSNGIYLPKRLRSCELTNPPAVCYVRYQVSVVGVCLCVCEVLFPFRFAFAEDPEGSPEGNWIYFSHRLTAVAVMALIVTTTTTTAITTIIKILFKKNCQLESPQSRALQHRRKVRLWNDEKLLTMAAISTRLTDYRLTNWLTDWQTDWAANWDFVVDWMGRPIGWQLHKKSCLHSIAGFTPQ